MGCLSRLRGPASRRLNVREITRQCWGGSSSICPPADRSERSSGMSHTEKQPTESPWSAEAVELYRDLVRARLSDRTCTACNASLASAPLVDTSTMVGPELNELGL